MFIYGGVSFVIYLLYQHVLDIVLDTELLLAIQDKG